MPKPLFTLRIIKMLTFRRLGILIALSSIAISASSVITVNNHTAETTHTSTPSATPNHSSSSLPSTSRDCLPRPTSQIAPAKKYTRSPKRRHIGRHPAHAKKNPAVVMPVQATPDRLCHPTPPIAYTPKPPKKKIKRHKPPLVSLNHPLDKNELVDKFTRPFNDPVIEVIQTDSIKDDPIIELAGAGDPEEKLPPQFTSPPSTGILNPPAQLITLQGGDRRRPISNPTFPAPPIPVITPAGAVPEPETYAMLLAGLGFIGFISKRKSRSS
jgi:PEP-CTERM motif